MSGQSKRDALRAEIGRIHVRKSRIRNAQARLIAEYANLDARDKALNIELSILLKPLNSLPVSPEQSDILREALERWFPKLE